MGLFGFLKSKKDTSDNHVDPQLQADIDRFENELFATVPRYISQPGAKVDIRARHQDTGEVIPFAIGFPEQFEPWRTVKSAADRRGIIYSLLDSQFGHQLELWQMIERFNDDRYAERALEIATEHKGESDEQNPNYWNALARTNFILTRYEEAEQNCLKAMAADPSNVRTKRIFADVLHCTGRQGRAHELYQEIQAEQLPKDAARSLTIQELLGFDGDITNSPVYAAEWLEGSSGTTWESWDWANDEFYYSPHFRARYAFHLLKNNEHMKGFAKLLSLSKEMPWFRDGVVNSYNLIDSLNLTDTMQEEKVRLRTIIENNNWASPVPNEYTITL